MAFDDTNAPVRAGDIVGDKYRVEGTIGSGGIGFVVAARHLALDEPVALKFLLSHQSGNRETTERLMREARATFRLRSPHTVRVHDVGELPSGHLFIVMELLEGRDLRAELDARGALPASEIVSLALDACEALGEAHALGIVHRDLKPGNLFLTKSAHGRRIAKVLDFGMSKLDPALYDGVPLTLPETALGTPRYMAPEQWQSASSVDLTADLWALGVVMYEMLTGKPPLHGMQLAERHARMLAGAIPSPRETRPDVPEDLARVVMRCLRADPRARWGSAAHLARALRATSPRSTEPTEVTRTGVTAVVPAEIVARRAADAFALARDPHSAASPETRPSPPPRLDQDRPHADEPAASSGPTAIMALSARPQGDDFEARTEIRAPMFTPAEAVARSGDIAAPTAPHPMWATLRSFEGSVLVPPDPMEATLRIPGAPPHPTALPAARTTAPLAPAVRPAELPVVPQAAPLPWAPPRPPSRTNVALYVALAALAGLAITGLVAWLLLSSR